MHHPLHAQSWRPLLSNAAHLFWTYSDIFDHIQTILGYIRTYSDIFRHIRTYLDIFGHIRTILEYIRTIFGHIRIIFGQIRTCSGIFGPHSDIMLDGPSMMPLGIRRRTSSVHACACFAYIYVCFCRVCCLPSPHTPIHKGGGAPRRLHKSGAAAFGGRPPLWIPLWMGVWGLSRILYT